MENIVVFRGNLCLLIHDERILSSEGIVRDADHLRVSNSVTLLLRWQAGRERAQVGQLGAELDLRSIHENGKNGLRCAGIIDDLVGEEQFRVVVCERLRFVRCWYPLEKEDEPEDGSAPQRHIFG